MIQLLYSAGLRKTITPRVLRHSSIRNWSRFKTNTSIIRA